MFVFKINITLKINQQLLGVGVSVKFLKLRELRKFYQNPNTGTGNFFLVLIYKGCKGIGVKKGS